MKTKTTQVLKRTGWGFSILTLVLLLTACHDSDENVNDPPPPPPPTSATVIPGVNPAFESVSEIASSSDAGGTYDAEPDATYDSATETVTLVAGSVPAGGLYIRVTGSATVGGTLTSYSVYSFVDSNTSNVAANELTSIAVGHVAEASAATFDEAVDQVAADAVGVTAADIVAATNAADRGAALSSSMMAVSNLFENGAFVPGTSSAMDTTNAIGQCFALGGLAWDNMSKTDAGGTGLLPANEPNKDYQRCKACHGWDQLGTDGGYARRSRKDTRPNAGYQDPNDVSRNISSEWVAKA